MNFRQIVQKEINKNQGLSNITPDALLCELLNLRGITTQDEAQKFLNPKNQPLSSPDVFCDMQKATERIKKAIENNEKILIWGDFDADGVTSSAIMYKTLNALGANFEIFIPNREEHGHGLNSKILMQYVAKHRVKVLITVDCGISNIAEIKLLNGFKVDTIITDHHKAEGELPCAFAILNAQAQNALKNDLSIREIKDLSYLCGAGVAYKFALELLKDEKFNNLKDELLILATVGTISDVVPVLGENRTIVAKGLELINQKKHTGIKLLFNNLKPQGTITSTDIAFLLTPRINAVGRLSTPDLAFDFLTQENESSLNFIIEKLDNFNKIRQSLCDNIYKEACDIINSSTEEKNLPAIVLFNENWHIGIIGIVASKLVETYAKPAFIITKNETQGRCSIRSIGEYNVYEILKKNADYFEGFGGHSLAGGFSFNIEKHSFEEIKTAILNTIEELKEESSFKNVLEVDKFIESSELNKNLLNTIELLEPFGQENPAPIFALKDVTLINSRTIGKNSNHLKFTCEKDGVALECVKWNEENLPLKQSSKLDIAFRPELNIFNNEETIQLFIEDVFSQEIKIQKTNTIKIYDHRKKNGILAQISNYLETCGLDVGIIAKKSKTLNALKDYPEISTRILNKYKKHDVIMFFDYPTDNEALTITLKKIKPQKIHIMKDDFDENIENYIKLTNGMLKYSHNHKNGEIDIEKMAQAIGVNESFIQIALEIFEAQNSLEILDIDKINYICAPDFEKVKTHSMFEILTQEFEKIIEFKKQFAEAKIDKLQKDFEKIY